MVLRADHRKVVHYELADVARLVLRDISCSIFSNAMMICNGLIGLIWVVSSLLENDRVWDFTLNSVPCANLVEDVDCVLGSSLVDEPDW